MVAGGRRCRAILEFLKNNKIATQQQLIEAGHPDRTVKNVLKKLTHLKLVHESSSFNDLRKKTYFYGGKK
ncbi:hypothetical protein HYU11_01260 [Candidatus Woesearchaeota archaeon]|nr:hypothetical protein [Candidatus Woesearchaeota archaeon]